MVKENPPADHLRKRLDYNPETGELTWKYRPEAPKCVNNAFCGKKAFTAKNADGYLTGRLDGKKYSAHRVIFAIVHGWWPEEVDHENHVRDDNRIANLKPVSHAMNGKNLRRQKNNTSGTTGVVWRKRENKWGAQIKANYKLYSLGLFENKEDAVAARKAAELVHGFHPNHGLAP